MSSNYEMNNDKGKLLSVREQNHLKKVGIQKEVRKDACQKANGQKTSPKGSCQKKETPLPKVNVS